MNKLSAIIVAKDNPKYLIQSIESIIDWIDDIVIIDIGLSQVLVDLLSSYKSVRIIKYLKPVAYVELIREEVKKFAENKYLIYLDPDELIDIELRQIILANYLKYDYLVIPRKNIFFGKWIEHSRWWPDYQVRVFKKDKVVWSTIIHSQPKLKGKGLTIEAQENKALIHYNYDNLDQFIEKLTRYTKVEATRLINDKKDYDLITAGRQGISEFVSRFFVGKGYLDGMHGLVLAFLQIFYYLLVYFYYWEAKNYQSKEKDLISIPNKFFSHGLSQVSHWSGQKTPANKIEKIKYKIIHKIINS